MKFNLKFIALGITTTSLILASVAASAHHRQQQSQQTITEIVAESGGDFDNNSHDYDLLLNAVLTAGLEGALADPDANLTVLAPNDRAFIRLAKDLGYTGNDEAGAFDAIVAALTTLGNGDPIPVLTNVLLYHVVPERLSLRDLIYASSISTLLTDATITPDRLRLIDNEPDVKNPRYVYPVNVRASNGIIQTINRVLIPLDIPGNDGSTPTDSIVDVVLASGGDFDHDYQDFDLLLNAVKAANLVGALADPSADLTVFAPNDAAFVRLARNLGYRGYDEGEAFTAIVEALTDLGNGDPIPLLTDILLYHVSPTSKTVKQVTDRDSIETLLTGAVLNPEGIVLVDGAPQLRSPKIKTRVSNINTSNGIIHTLNRVLIPLDVAPVRNRYRRH